MKANLFQMIERKLRRVKNEFSIGFDILNEQNQMCDFQIKQKPDDENFGLKQKNQLLCGILKNSTLPFSKLVESHSF